MILICTISLTGKIAKLKMLIVLAIIITIKSIKAFASRFRLKQLNTYISKLFFVSLIGLFTATKINAQCTAEISTNTKKGCETLTIQFTDQSTGAVQSRTWDFGDGSPFSGVQNPTHTYNAGVNGDTTYIVTLTTQCISGGSSSARDTVTVYKKPFVDFTTSKTTICALSDSACLTNLSTTGTGFAYAWNFGDANSSTIVSPCHIYSTGASKC